MIKVMIPYRAVYSLLDKHYARTTDLKGVLKESIQEDIFNSSLIFAEGVEDYQYLSVMKQHFEMFSDKYAIFTNLKHYENPIILEKNKDLHIMDFAVLHSKTVIHKSYFIDVIHSICINRTLSDEETNSVITEFEDVLEALDHTESTTIEAETKKGD